MIDAQAYFGKIANNEAISVDEVSSILKELRHFQMASAHLASCQAATLESLPKSAGKGAFVRHKAICLDAARLLSGDSSSIRYPTNLQHAIERCSQAVADHG